jgi:hypothetical protein
MLVFGVGLTLAGPGEVRLATAASAQAVECGQDFLAHPTIPEVCCPPTPIGTEGPEGR